MRFNSFQPMSHASKKRKVVDLTVDSPPAAKLNRVYVVLIHQYYTRRSGSDYQFDNSLPTSEDTEVLGVFLALAGAIEKVHSWGIDNSLFDDEEEAEDQLEDTDLVGEPGYVHEGDEDRDQRIFVREMIVQP